MHPRQQYRCCCASGLVDQEWRKDLTTTYIVSCTRFSCKRELSWIPLATWWRDLTLRSEGVGLRIVELIHNHAISIGLFRETQYKMPLRSSRVWLCRSNIMPIFFRLPISLQQKFLQYNAHNISWCKFELYTSKFWDWGLTLCNLE